MANWLQIIGLVSDFIGAFILAKEYLFKDTTKIGTWGWFEGQQEEAVKTKRVTIKGIKFVAAGFLFQVASTAINLWNTP